MTDSSELAQVCALAAQQAPAIAAATSTERAGWLVALAESLEGNADELVGIADRETRLGVDRLNGEVVRTAKQLRFFAAAIQDGRHLELTIDNSDPSAFPPRPELRRMLRPIGPVAIFGASNFPFAFSVLGGDTTSALAAGCPVIVKAHPAHPELSRAIAAHAIDALSAVGAPRGLFALVEGYDAGLELVKAPEIAAVAFTGSTGGGRALFDIASQRPHPIPFYGELGSINPVVITEDAAEERGAELATGLATAFTRESGQYCTKPGLIFAPADLDFASAVATAVADVPARFMLTPGILSSFASGARQLVESDGATLVAGNLPEKDVDGLITPIVVAAASDAVLADPDVFFEERFGPLTLIVRYRDREQLDELLAHVPGSLTATIFHAEGEHLGTLPSALTRIAGRVVFNGWPNGVALGWAQNHGGPWPASTNPLHTSVGFTATRRFLVPVVFQNAPDSALPAELRSDNPLGLPRLVDGLPG
ncbi:MAG: aldehyde dehydrogenase (NADP(+)) [Mycetocola sp.]